MKALVAFHSLFGNTKQLAEVIAAQFGGETSVSLKPLQQVTPADLQGIALFVLGTPTHKLTIPAAAGQFLSRLRRLGGKPAASAGVFWVEGMQGPLASGELELANAWARTTGQ